MITTKAYCDRCLEEIKDFIYFLVDGGCTTLTSGKEPLLKAKFDLCRKCHEKVFSELKRKGGTQ